MNLRWGAWLRSPRLPPFRRPYTWKPALPAARHEAWFAPQPRPTLAGWQKYEPFELRSCLTQAKLAGVRPAAHWLIKAWPGGAAELGQLLVFAGLHQRQPGAAAIAPIHPPQHVAQRLSGRSAGGEIRRTHHSA